MAKVLQVIDVDSDGHKVRLDDGRVIFMPHGGSHPQIGQEVPRDAHLGAVAEAPVREETFNAVDTRISPGSRQESEHPEEKAPVE